MCVPVLGWMAQQGGMHRCKLMQDAGFLLSPGLRSLPGGQWDPKSRHWRFPLSQHDRLVQALQVGG